MATATPVKAEAWVIGRSKGRSTGREQRRQDTNLHLGQHSARIYTGESRVRAAWAVESFPLLPCQDEGIRRCVRGPTSSRMGRMHDIAQMAVESS